MQPVEENLSSCWLTDFVLFPRLTKRFSDQSLASALLSIMRRVSSGTLKVKCHNSGAIKAWHHLHVTEYITLPTCALQRRQSNIAPWCHFRHKETTLAVLGSINACLLQRAVFAECNCEEHTSTEVRSTSSTHCSASVCPNPHCATSSLLPAIDSNGSKSDF